MTFHTLWRTAGNRGIISCCLYALICIFILTFVGCASTIDAVSLPVGVNPSFNNASRNTGTASKELAVARRMINAGDYALVIPRLMHITSKYPNSAAAIDARYLLGLAYY